MIYLDLIITVFLIYLLAVIVVGAVDVHRISTKGQKLLDRKRMLETLAGIHGYSSVGWNRYHEYQTFIEEYDHVIRLYEDYRKNPITTTIIVYLSSFVMVFVYAWSWIKKEKK